MRRTRQPGPVDDDLLVARSTRRTERDLGEHRRADRVRQWGRHRSARGSDDDRPGGGQWRHAERHLRVGKDLKFVGEYAADGCASRPSETDPGDDDDRPRRTRERRRTEGQRHGRRIDHEVCGGGKQRYVERIERFPLDRNDIDWAGRRTVRHDGGHHRIADDRDQLRLNFAAALQGEQDILRSEQSRTREGDERADDAGDGVRECRRRDERYGRRLYDDRAVRSATAREHEVVTRRSPDGNRQSQRGIAEYVELRGFQAERIEWAAEQDFVHTRQPRSGHDDRRVLERTRNRPDGRYRRCGDGEHHRGGRAATGVHDHRISARSQLRNDRLDRVGVQNRELGDRVPRNRHARRRAEIATVNLDVRPRYPTVQRQRIDDRCCGRVDSELLREAVAARRLHLNLPQRRRGERGHLHGDRRTEVVDREIGRRETR